MLVLKHFYKIVVWTTIFVCSKTGGAQEVGTLQKQISFGELTVEQGLSQNSVVSIAQDSTGYMWFATQDGLNRYDGKQFYHYGKQFDDVTRSTYSKLGKVYVDRDGKLWIIPKTGTLERYNQVLDNFEQVPGITNASTLIQSKDGFLYVGTYGNGMYKTKAIDAEPLQILPPEYGALSNYDFLETPAGILAATSKGLLSIQGNSYKINEIAGFQDIALSALAKDSKHSFYLGSFGNGLFTKTEATGGFEQFNGFYNSTLPTTLNILDLAVDAQNRLWIATYGDGAYLIDFKNETLQHFVANKTNPYALHYNDVLCLYKDFTNTMWLGTDGAGLSFYDQHLVKFNVLTNKQIPANIHVDVTRAISVDKNAIWLGTSGKGLTRIELPQQDYKSYTSSNSNLAGDRIMSLLQDEQGLWIGHQNQGLQLLSKNGTFKDFPVTDGFTIWKLYKDNNGLLWLCTSNQGLVAFNPSIGITKSFTAENSGLSTNNIRTVVQGDNKTLWIGTEDQGVFKMELQTAEISKIDEIPDPVKCFYYSKNLLWVGTNGNGLKLYNTHNKTLHSYGKDDGLPNNVIYGILPDEDNNLWLSSNRGLTKFSIDPRFNPVIENYSNYDGLQASEYNTGAYFKDDKGVLYFGGLEGINWFQPSKLTLNPKVPKTVITGLEVFNEEHEIVSNQKFHHNENTLTFTFASLHFSQPERNRYKYRLVNNDPDWITAENNNVAHYTNLPPDDYEFQVISSNYDGVWNEIPSTYSFSIAQPWYASNLAKVLYLLAFLMLLYGLYAYLKWRWNVKNQLRIEHEETERLKKLDEFKAKLYTNISHEIRTPLTLISGPVENQLKRPDLAKEDKSDLMLIKQNSKRLITLVDQMLDLSLADSGTLKLNIEHGNLAIYLKQLLNTFQYKAKRKNITIHKKIENLEDCWFDSDIIEKTATNLVHNALKYSPKNASVTIDAKKEQNWFILSVTNNKGELAVFEINQLFNRFYQSDEASEGIGVGLALVKELVSLHKGNIIAHTDGGNNIQFTVTIPIVKEAFNEDEIIFKEPVFHVEKQSKVDKNDEDRPTLLVVEDNDEVRTYISSVFLENYRILEAENGEEGILKAQEHMPDLIISDIRMPIKSGIVLCNTIKTNELTSHIPIILLTAKVGKKHEIEGLKTGADAYITKPFSIEKLRIRVEKLIQQREKIKEHFSKTFSIDPDLAITSTETEFLNRIQQVLDTHITDPELTSEKFANLMLVSRTQLHRKLKSIVGMSTTEFIRSQRLKIASRLLQQKDVPISEIAYQIGFNSPSYFNKCFKETFGYSPSQYRSKHEQ
ncbi:two-component regulator propeller domain-containing protein [Marinirhabdus gelatinilytica]|uniref:histidine kinase n=1 Tax=Marinirhabdus gelatinilytica TaxID=1703343 RepID=A0A370Q521_9FLAO|nr:two-component regulator propeller domain-containing protein [Marinirhabdus gelatinilytica]RDK83465.1 two component regulator with propeller domain [Marinirhabdus gelatinilytica]